MRTGIFEQSAVGKGARDKMTEHKIEKLYVVLSKTEYGESIAAINMLGMNMQAVSSEKRIIDMAYERLRELSPNIKFYIKKFVINQER